ncbi:hypothetical protein AAVH_20957 [Aphelenchoides avenae]|nr:hypothetical protein AAVH_20957 [Aphelenchus avenae]
MPSDLFHEAFFFLTRHEAENLRTVCRPFDALTTGLRDVHGYKLQIDWMDIRHNADGPPVPAEYCAYVKAYGRLYEIQGVEEEVASGLKAALRVSFVRSCRISTLALTESLCGESVAFFGGVSAESVNLAGQGEPTGIVDFCRPDSRYQNSTYYETVTSSKLWHYSILNFLLSFDAVENLRLDTKFLEEDLADDFVLRCRAKRMGTLTVLFGVQLRLQEASEEELLQKFYAMKHSLISATRSAV